MNETYKKQVANFIRKNNLQTLSRVDDFKSKYFSGWE
ncbi:hypothetical protein SAMN05216582_106118 [Selenomonas ruminantium]|uniref:Uncharacterized protein n=1 Tax=Selenomonas ruminantium TaxID=971 RepID=A0A1M6T6R6_SELRU|nr:hypothetical protein SAMN05216582_106118 [Selenomonas ruminantium]